MIGKKTIFYFNVENMFFLFHDVLVVCVMLSMQMPIIGSTLPNLAREQTNCLKFAKTTENEKKTNRVMKKNLNEKLIPNELYTSDYIYTINSTQLIQSSSTFGFTVALIWTS